MTKHSGWDSSDEEKKDKSIRYLLTGIVIIAGIIIIVHYGYKFYCALK